MSSSSAALAKQHHDPANPTLSTNSASFQSPWQKNLLLCLLLGICVLASYCPVIHNGFINFDDDTYILDNPHVKAGLTWSTVKWAFTTFDNANWAPLSWLSHALDCELFGLNSSGHHSMSVLLHSANAILLFLLLQAATGSRWRSLMVAALFALHPMNVESVAWAAERKNVLSMLFFLLALHAYTWYTRKPAILRYAAVFFLFAFGLLSKSQIVTFPFLLFLWDYWPLYRIFPSADSDALNQSANGLFRWKSLLLWEKVPLLLLSASSAVVTMKAEKAGGAVASQYSLLLRLETAVIAYAHYLGKAVWPSKLVALYPHPTKLYPAWQVGAAVILLALITAVVFLAPRRRYLIVGWLWFLGSLVPMIGLVQVGSHAIADRFAYLPFIGLFLICTWLAADCCQAGRVPTARLALVAVSCLLILGVLTYRQVGYWHDIRSFWQRTLALTENNYVAHDSLGVYLASQGDTDEAVAHFRAAIAIRPDDLPANLNLGTYEHGRGNFPAAIARYQMVAEHAADLGVRSKAYANLGSVYRQMGDVPKAKAYFEAAVHFASSNTLAIVGLGLVAEKNGDSAEAVRQFSIAMSVEPTDVGFLLLAHALEQEGKLDQANLIRERVARFSPNLPEAQKVADSLLTGK
jgi:tetratricopeptide (TPR) repeat protein